MDKIEIKKSLSGKLPRGFSGTIRGRLKERGVIVSLSLISKVCNSETNNWNNDIIVEALKLANDEVKVLTSIQEQAAAL